MTETRLRPTVGVTIGDPAGIGPEIVVRALAEDAARQSLDVVVIGDRWVLQRATGATGVGVEFVAEGSPRLIDLANVDHRLQWGKVQATAGAAGGQCTERGVREALAGRVDALATAPISKAALWRAGYRYPGHTEMLGALTGRPDPLTMFQVRNLRIFFLTRHLSLREAVDQVARSRIAAILPRIDEALRSIGFERPRVAVAALNPHAGEGGALGLEDQQQIAPAVEEARSRGIDVHGPVPADAVFAQAMEGRYDAVLSLYHDQGHIAAKTVDFHGAVSVTLGLPFIRTSVDHGTAFDIAGQGVAPRALLAAAAPAAPGPTPPRARVGRGPGPRPGTARRLRRAHLQSRRQRGGKERQRPAYPLAVSLRPPKYKEAELYDRDPRRRGAGQSADAPRAGRRPHPGRRAGGTSHRRAPGSRAPPGGGPRTPWGR